MWLSPTEPQPAPVSTDNTTVAQVKEPETPPTVDQKEGITNIQYSGGGYVVEGTGIANENYSMKFSNDAVIDVRTDNNGKYAVKVPESASVFGDVELTRDTNGFWFGGKEAYEKGYYALTDEHPQYSSDALEPILLGVGGSSPYEVSGYYVPGVELVLKSGDKVLSTAKVDDTGRYKFDNISLDANYVLVTVYEKVSTGWFSSKENKLIDGRYLDTSTHRVLAELPTITKEESKKETVPFDSQTVESSSLPKGETRVTQEGMNGEKTITYRIVYKGNDEVGRKIVGESITKQPTIRITTVGTYVAPPVNNTPPPTYATPPSQPSVYYRNCSAARAAGAAPVYAGQPGYGSHLDRDNDGIGCEQ